MPGLVPGIHEFFFSTTIEDVDGRDKPGHDSILLLGIPLTGLARTL
jgi:hypothetical protein